MATAKAPVAVSTLSNADIMNSIRAISSSSYQDRIPLATQDSITETGNAILSADLYYNEFLHNLVDKIAFQYIHSFNLRNPLGEFKRGMMPWGKTIEEIFTDIAEANAYDPELAEDEVFKRVIPDTSVIYHIINRADFYKQTIEYAVLSRAFYSEGGLSRLTETIYNALWNGDRYDEYNIMKQLVGQYYNNGYFYGVNVDAVVDETSAKSFVTSVRSYVSSMNLPSRKFNSMGVMRTVAPEDQVLFMRPELDATVDVNVLAAAFNMSKAEFLARRIIVDDFGPNTENLLAVLVDREFIVQYDTVEKTEEIYNPQGLYWNIFLHHHGVYSTSRFANGVAFTSSAVSVTGVTVTPTTPVLPGRFADQKAAVTGAASAYVPQGVTWSVSGQTSSGTYIDKGGRLFVSSNETAETLTVKATSTYDTSKSGTATVSTKSA